MTESVIGIIKKIKELSAKNGSKMAFAVIDNSGNDLDIVFFANAWEKCNSSIVIGKEVNLLGRNDFHNGKRSFIVEEVVDNKNNVTVSEIANSMTLEEYNALPIVEDLTKNS